MLSLLLLIKIFYDDFHVIIHFAVNIPQNIFIKERSFPWN